MVSKEEIKNYINVAIEFNPTAEGEDGLISTSYFDSERKAKLNKLRENLGDFYIEFRDNLAKIIEEKGLEVDKDKFMTNVLNYLKAVKEGKINITLGSEKAAKIAGRTIAKQLYMRLTQPEVIKL